MVTTGIYIQMCWQRLKELRGWLSMRLDRWLREPLSECAKGSARSTTTYIEGFTVITREIVLLSGSNYVPVTIEHIVAL